MLTIRCSGLSRPMTCAGSLFFKDLPEQPTNAAAEEGTAAGEYLQYLLENNLAKPPQHNAKNGVAFDRDMEFYTRPIAEKILSDAANVRCEQSIDWQTKSGIWIKGQYDIAYHDDNTLYIEDLKYGWGIIEPNENWQLLGYAIGEVIRLQRHFEKIVFRIHQPRPHHEEGPTRTWEISYATLLEYMQKIEDRCHDIVAGERSLVTSSKCRYCPAAGAACPAISKAMYRGIEVAHDHLQDDLTNEEISFQLDLLSRVTEVLKIKTDSLNALAVDRVKQGQLIPHSVTEANYGHRNWNGDVDPETIKILTGKNIVREELLSPAQAEKIGVPKDFVAALTSKKFLGQKLVRKDGSDIGNKIFGKGK